MRELRKALKTKLKTIHSGVYFQIAPETARFPYLVYDIPNDSDDGESMELVIVDIDGWDSPDNGDTTALEILMSSVNASLNKSVLTTESMSVVLYLDTKLSLTDDDPRIRRRKYTYQAKLFKRG